MTLVRRALLAPALLAVALTCSSDSPAGPGGGGGGGTADAVPLTDMGPAATYLGFGGGLYPGSENVPPADHAAEGARRAALVEPLDADGDPDPNGAIVLLSVGMSNASMEFCGGDPCRPGSFGARAAADPAVDDAVVIVDGALFGEPAEEWDSPASGNYDRIRDERLGPNGLSESQVRVVWLKQAHSRPTTSLPAGDADARALLEDLGQIVRALAARYPNLEQVFVSSRTYGGYAETALNPEPYAYESGFSVKWLVEAQIEQARGGGVDPRAGDLAYASVPWVAWGPYLWAEGATPRSDGLAWSRGDFADDGTHPSPSGVAKVGDLLHVFFRTAPSARCWFLEVERC